MRLFNLLAGTALALALGTGAQAAVFTSLSSWQSAMGTYSETNSLGFVGSTISSFTTTDGTPVAVGAQNNRVEQIGSGWSTWSGGYGGQLLTDYTSTSLVLTLGAPVRGFGFFVEPEPFALEDITVTTAGGATLTQNVDGNGGADFFGFTGPGLSSFTVTSPQGFGTGDFFSAVGVPEPSTWAMLILGLGAVGVALRRRKVALAA